jgi:hypothetical protein
MIPGNSDEHCRTILEIGYHHHSKPEWNVSTAELGHVFKDKPTPRRMIAGTPSRDISLTGETWQIFNTFGSLMHFQLQAAPNCHEDSYRRPIVPCQSNQQVIPRTFGSPIVRPEHPALFTQWHT